MKQEKESRLARIGISLPVELMTAFDRLIRQREYRNRSEAIRDLIREKLVEQEWEESVRGVEVIGTITYVYDHHKRELVNEILEIQHGYPGVVVASQHVHLDHHNCLEVAIVRGSSPTLSSLAHRLKALKGVKHCQLTMTTTGARLE